MSADRGFFGSKHFIISAIVAGIILVAGATAYSSERFFSHRSFSGGCAAPALVGEEIAAAPEGTRAPDGKRRTVTYRFATDVGEPGSVDLCSPFGDVTVEASSGDVLEIVFEIASSYAGAVDMTDVAASMRSDGGRLVVGGWVERIGEDDGTFDTDSADVRVIARVPQNGAWDVIAHSSAGDVRATDLLVGELDLESSFGDVVAMGIDLVGNATLSTSAGDAVLSLASVVTASIDAGSSFGDVDVELPARADVGYDVVADTSFGEVTLRIGPTEQYESNSDHAGERETARTAGFDSKLTKVSVSAESSSGDVRVVTAGS